MIKDVGSRALKTFIQAFFGVLIPIACGILSNLADYDFANWKVWALPAVAGALSAGISAAWNIIKNHLSADAIEKK